VVRVRSKVQRAVDATKQSLAEGPRPYGSTRKTSPARLTICRDSPWQAVGIAALVGAVVGI